MKRFYSNGKILLCGEYVITKGAKAIGLPTKMGQDLCVINNSNNIIKWTSLNSDKKIWFECILNIKKLDIIETTDEAITLKLIQILKICKEINPNFLISGKTVRTNLTFDFNWGLGTSSTLINNISQWANVNPYFILNKSFGGSGYDIACAQNNSSILFSKHKTNNKIVSVNFSPSFKEYLFFIYQNKKQNTQLEIKEFNNKSKISSNIIDDISNLSIEFLKCANLKDFSKLIDYHENLIGSLLNKKPLKSKFPDYKGTVKNLGAWGGDFFLAAGPKDSLDYFINKNLKTGFKYQEIIKEF